MKHMTTEAFINKVSIERNIAPETSYLYKLSIQYFEEHTGTDILEMIQIAKKEEKDPKILWADSTLRTQLISFRAKLYRKHKQSTADIYFNKITSTFKHTGVTIGELPSISTKRVLKGTPIYPEDVPDREVIETCIKSSPTVILKPLALCFSSTGLSVADVLKLTVRDYLDATMEYHHSTNIELAIYKMQNSKEMVIPPFKSSRRKTGINYVTFGSPEFVDATNSYLLTRENLTLDDPLFSIARRHVNRIFQKVNDNLGLGKVNDEVSRFSPKMLRIYQATQLHEAGVPSEMIDIMQGRTPKGIIYKSYIRIKTSLLKEAYIQALPYIVIDNSAEIKTKLQIIEEENQRYKEIVENIDERIEKKIAESMKKNISEEEFQELFS